MLAEDTGSVMGMRQPWPTPGALRPRTYSEGGGVGRGTRTVPGALRPRAYTEGWTRQRRAGAEAPRPPSWSDDEHRIPITVEPVPLRHRLAIRFEHQLAPAERADQHEQRRLRQMEVGEQPAHDAKSKP